MNRLEFGQHFDETVRAAANGPLPDAKRVEFFLPQSNSVLNRRTNGVMNAVALAIAARRMEEVDAWIRREMAKHLPAEVCALPDDEFALALFNAGVYGKDVTMRDDAPGVQRFALYGRVQDGPDDLLATMMFEPTFNGEDEQQIS